MKFKCQQLVLLEALSVVGRIVGIDNVLQVLNNVYLSLKGDKLTLTTTNLELAISCVVDVVGEGDGVITVPVKLLVGYISLLVDKEVSFVLDENLTLHGKTISSNVEIKGIAGSEFPTIPSVKNEIDIKIPTSILKEAFEKTVFATAMDQIRPILTGVLLKTSGSDMVVVGTDSYRLAEKRFELLKENKEVVVIIPNKTVFELCRLFNTKEEFVNIEIATNQAKFVFGNTVVISRLIEGKYPPYEQIIPKENKTVARIPINTFSQAVKRVSLFTKDKSKNIKLDFKKSGKLKLHATSSQLGHEDAEISADIQGDGGKIAFNATYILDVLNHIKGDEVCMEISDDIKPGLLRGDKDDNYRCVIMPLSSS